jgi:hypothetical protein
VTDTDSPARRFGHLDVFAAIGALSFLVARYLPVLALPYTCPARGLLGIPCATCGMTHAFVALAHGDLLDALASSPLGAALAAGVWGLVLLDLLRLALGRPFPRIPAGALRLATGAGALALLLNWAWLLARS